jgi:hypothetical protein
MKHLEMLNSLKLNLNAKNIDFGFVIANKSIKINHPALIKSKIDIVVSCEKDEYGTYLKVQCNDDCMGMFDSVNDREFTSASACARIINRAIKTENAYWQL